MQTASYTTIRPAIGQTEAYVIKKAHALGYELVKFNGWDNDDLCSSGSHGPRWDEARANNRILNEIQDACMITYADGTYDYPHIKSTATNETEK